MGVCKCRKRSDLFCFNHKRAVCGSCIEEHGECTVRTYRAWLRDSAYLEPACVKCGHSLLSSSSSSSSSSFDVTTHTNGPEDAKDKSWRLLCLHLIHENCLREYILSF